MSEKIRVSGNYVVSVRSDGEWNVYANNVTMNTALFICTRKSDDRYYRVQRQDEDELVHVGYWVNGGRTDSIDNK